MSLSSEDVIIKEQQFLAYRLRRIAELPSDEYEKNRDFWEDTFTREYEIFSRKNGYRIQKKFKEMEDYNNQYCRN